MQTGMTSAQTDVPLTINLRTLTLMDIFSQGWRLYWKNFPQLLPIVLIIYLPLNLLRYLFINPSAMTFYAYAGQLLEMAFTLFGFMAVVGLIEGAVYGQPLTWRTALHYAGLRWDRAVGTMFRLSWPFLGWFLLWLILTLLLVFFTSTLLIWPLVFLLFIGMGKWFVDYGFAFHVVALRGISGNAALAYSKALTQNQWWQICGCQLAIIIPVALPSFCLIAVTLLLPYLWLTIFVTTLTQLGSMLSTVMGVLLFLRTEQRQRDASVLTDSDIQEPLSLEDEADLADDIADDIGEDSRDPVTDAPLRKPAVSARRPQWFALTFALGAGLLLLLLLVLINV